MHEQPTPLDYAPPSAQRSGGWGHFVRAFLCGWVLGVVVAGVLGDVFNQVMFGHHYQGTYFLAAYAILLAALRAVLKERLGAGFAFLFGLVCGPVILGARIAIG
jgi:hypothetical protein